MSATLYHYPSCSTCRKARNWLGEQGIEVELVHIVDAAPTLEQIREFWEKSGLDLKRFFNTSGGSYRALDLKNTYAGLTDDARLELLANDGKLLKRPIYANGDTVLVGFKVAEWEEALG